MLDPKESRVYCFPVEIILAAQKAGIELATLNEMVMHSTRITHPNGNRRYNGWLFKVEGNDVLGFGRVQDAGEEETRPKVHEAVSSVDAELECVQCDGTKVVLAFDPCERCDGKGCKYCDKGLVPGHMRCPVCV